jgi:hypothetical protein
MIPPPHVERLASTDETESGPKIVFYRAEGEVIRYPDDVVSLLTAQRIQTGGLVGRNPITHDQWWIPVAALVAAGAPYAKALTFVVQAWLKERKGRQVRLEIGKLRITANTVTEAERLLAALNKHAKQIDGLQVTKARKRLAKRARAKTTGKHRKS